MKENRKKPEIKQPIHPTPNAPQREGESNFKKPLVDKSNYNDRKNPRGGCGC